MSMVNWEYYNDGKDTGEGGLWAYAVWDFSAADMDKHVVIDSVPVLGDFDVVVSVVGPLSDDFSVIEGEFDNEGFGFKTVVFLGSTDSATFVDSIEDYFTVTEETLTTPGRNVIRALENLYGGTPATYITLLDT